MKVKLTEFSRFAIRSSKFIVESERTDLLLFIFNFLVFLYKYINIKTLKIKLFTNRYFVI